MKKNRLNQLETTIRLDALCSQKRIAILGIDTFGYKNISQVELMNKHGYCFDVFTNDFLGDSSLQFERLNKTNNLIKLHRGFISRLRQLFVYFLKQRKQLNHAEVYSGGRFAFFYGILCQVFKVKYIVVERGDLKSIIGGRRLKLMYQKIPDDKTIHSNVLYLYLHDGKLEYAVRNNDGAVERVKIHHMLGETKDEFVRILTKKTQKINSDQKSVLFKITSEKDHTLHELSFFYRLTFQYVYKFANAIWYKEPYMEGLLKKMRIQRLSMIANAVDAPVRDHSISKQIDFIWVNRMVHRRNFEWVVSYFYNKTMLKTVALGYLEEHRKYLPRDAALLLEDLKKQDHFELHGYIEPKSYYERAKFFVLPATFVFGNHSLLEAMSYGVIPIVSDTAATSLVVQHNVNGIIFQHDYESFSAAIEQAINMDEVAYKQMSDRAKQSIADHFSLAQWENKLKSLYCEL